MSDRPDPPPYGTPTTAEVLADHPDPAMTVNDVRAVYGLPPVPGGGCPVGPPPFDHSPLEGLSRAYADYCEAVRRLTAAHGIPPRLAVRPPAVGDYAAEVADLRRWEAERPVGVALVERDERTRIAPLDKRPMPDDRGGLTVPEHLPPPPVVTTAGTPSPHMKATFIVTYDPPCDTPVEVRSDG